MTAIPQSAYDGAVSHRLTTPLRQVAKRRYQIDAIVAICKTLCAGLTVLLFAVLILGYLQKLWMPVRVIVALIAWSLVVTFSIRFLRPLLSRWNLIRAAMHVEQDRPDLHERLSSAIELSQNDDPNFAASPGLLAHLFKQAEADATAVRPNQMVSGDRVTRWALVLAPIVIAWLTLTVIPATTHITLAGLYRVLLPWQTALPDMLSQIVVKPGDVTLVQGDSMDVTAHLSFNINSGSVTLLRKYTNGPTVTDIFQQADPRNYQLHLDNLQQTFTYCVSSAKCDSPWFTAIVHPRPQLTGIEIRCDYPAYTGLTPTISTDRDGAIQALVGTKVTMRMRTAEPVAMEKSKVVIDGGSAVQSALALTQPDAGKSEYQVQFTLSRTVDYRINLTNEFDLSNKDEPLHSIVAIPDEVPTITIVSPEPKTSVGVQDNVPVRYIARDDFGVAKIEALLQVGDSPVQTLAVNFTAEDKRKVDKPAFVISVAGLLKGMDIHRSDTISYQLKVTDNRDPDPQVGLSAKQVLKLDLSDPQKYQDRTQEKTAEDLETAVKRAIDQLNHEQQNVQTAGDVDPKRALDEWHRRPLDQAAKALPQTDKQLKTAADEAQNTVFAEIAEQVKAVADKPIQSAADDTAQADLNMDKGQDRQDAALRAVAEIDQAKHDLQKILDNHEIEKQLAQAQAARDLEDAAEKQQEAADLMKTSQQFQQAPQKHDHQAEQQQRQAMRDQDQANQKLQRALQQDEALRDPQAQETAQKLQQLIHKVDDAAKHQDAAEAQTEKQQAAEGVRQAANAIAQQQETLNKEIQQEAEQHQQALEQANANPPAEDQQQNIVKALDQNNLQEAHQRMNQAAEQLHHAAQNLQDLAHAKDLHPTSQQQDTVNDDQHAVDEAQKDRDAAQHAADELKQTPTAPTDHAAETDTRTAAEQIKKQARELHPKNDQSKTDAQGAVQHANAAEHAADQAVNAAGPKEAQTARATAAAELTEAAKELAQAAKENADAQKAVMVAAQQKSAQAAADQVAQQARKQAELAQAVTAQQNALAQVQNPPQADQSADQQNQITEQTKDAKKDAEQLEQQAEHANNANVQARAKHAEAELATAQDHAAHAAQAQQEAAHDQHQASDANNAHDAATAEQRANQALAQAAEQQHQARAALAKAQGDLRDMATHQQTSAQQANAQLQQAAQAAQEAAQAAQEAAQAAQEAAQAQQDASQQNQAAAQQAANALAHAAQALAKGLPGQQPSQPNSPQDPDAKPSLQPAEAGGRNTESKDGISLAGLAIKLPQSVLDMGITADQWAVLPPLVKKDLLNAAQQNGPPAYRQMMRDYFAKVAKMQTVPGQP
jgi:hypothetical protein